MIQKKPNWQGWIMKKLGFLLVLFIYLLALPDNSFAAAVVDTRVILDGTELVQPENTKAEIMDKKVMVPIRIVSESLGYDVLWNKQAQTVTISKEDTHIEMTVGQKTAKINTETVFIDAPPVIKKGTTLVPLRFVGEQMNLKVGWNNKTKTVTLTSPIPEVIVEEGETDPTTSPPDETGGSIIDGAIPNELSTVSAISFSDNRLIVTTSGKVGPKIFAMKAPDRLVIDLPNSAFAPTFGDGQVLNGSQMGELIITDSSEVTKVRYSLFTREPSAIRIVLDLRQATSYQLVSDDSGLYVVDLNVDGDVDGAPIVPPIGADGKKIVVIDPGHGGAEPGKVALTGLQEKILNLTLSLKVEQLLKQVSAINVVMTRTDDTTLSLSSRAQLANALNADMFVSVHANSFTTSTPSGTETYYARDSSIPLAKTIHRYLLEATGLKDRGVKYNNYHVIRETTMPAVLLETGFMSNPSDLAVITNEAVQMRMATGIVEGIKEYLGIK
ncbi:N-acetylmuramoyl-L-alanine amidase family protein [Paenibacillus sp. KS-LC4]|uniref:N-acetylmuramoyl-L-alanine amidase family protein n=1 Tax=Paenibacillus sp. KS-LC4 TaxID=2979727 RepID=UPI0030CC06D2